MKQGNSFLRNRGVAPIVSQLIAISVFSVAAVFVARVASSKIEEMRIERVGENVVQIGTIALNYTQLNYESLLTEAKANGDVKILTLDDLAALDSRLEGMSAKSTFGQPFKVCLHVVDSENLEVIAGTAASESLRATLPSMYPVVTVGHERMFLGYVPKDESTTLRASGLKLDLTAIQGTCGFPYTTDVIAYRYLTPSENYGNQLYRTDLGREDLNTMKTDLLMGNKNISGVGELAAKSAKITENLDVQGAATLADELIVTGKSTFQHDVEITESLVGTDAIFSGGLAADSAKITQGTETQTATVLNTLTAGQATVADKLTAGDTVAGSLTTPVVNTRQLTSNTVTTTDIKTGTAQITGTIDATNGAFNDLTIGTCNGC